MERELRSLSAPALYLTDRQMDLVRRFAGTVGCSIDAAIICITLYGLDKLEQEEDTWKKTISAISTKRRKTNEHIRKAECDHG